MLRQKLLNEIFIAIDELIAQYPEQEEILIELKDCVDYDIYDKMDAKTSIYAIEDSMLDLFTAIDDECLDDRDISDISINSICNYLSAFEIDFYIHRNQYNNEKDYGVPKERIIDTVRKM